LLLKFENPHTYFNRVFVSKVSTTNPLQIIMIRYNKSLFLPRFYTH